MIQFLKNRHLVGGLVLCSSLFMAAALEARPSDEFLAGFEHEVANRAFALRSAQRLSTRMADTEYAGFWSAYLRLEQFNAPVYDEVAVKWGISTDPAFWTRFRAWAVSLTPEPMMTMALESTLARTRAYVITLQELQSIGPEDDRAFLEYMVAQEQLQVEMMRLALAGSSEEIPALVDAFISQYSHQRPGSRTGVELNRWRVPPRYLARQDKLRDAQNLKLCADWNYSTGEITMATERKAKATGATPRSARAEGPREGLNGPDPKLMEGQSGIWNFLMDRYFRLEFDGFERLPDEPCLLIGVHSGGPLTMDAWTVGMAWWRHFGDSRTLHGTAHDVLMSAPGLGRYFRRLGTISPSRENLQAAFDKGDDVILWPGGEVDAYRAWSNRDKAVLGGRKGFIRMAIRAGVPIVPVATVGGHDTLFVLSEGRGLAKALKLKERMRSDVAPITLSVPFGVTLHLTPFQHIPLPAKIRTRIMDPIYLDSDPARLEDQAYVDAMYKQIEDTIQIGMDELASQRRFPVFG